MTKTQALQLVLSSTDEALANRLVKLQSKLNRQNSRNTKLADIIRSTGPGANNLASWLINRLGADDESFPPYTADYAVAMKKLPANAYDVWCCWKRLMLARDEFAKFAGEL